MKSFSRREALSEGNEQLRRTFEANLPSQQRPNEVLLFGQEAEPSLRVGGDTQIGLANLSFLDVDLLVVDDNGGLAIFGTCESEVIRGVQPD